MKLAGRAGWVGVVASLALLAAGGLAIERRREAAVTPDLRLVAAPADVELSWGVGPARAPGVRGRPDIARERSSELPAWFGLARGAPVRIAGHVRGGVHATTIRLAIDVPDPGIWAGRERAVGADGAFDFGAMRPGPYVLIAAGPMLQSHALRIDTAQAAADAVELALVPCQPVRGAVEQANGDRWGDRGPAPGAVIELAGTPIGTTDLDGRFEVCAADEDDLRIRGAGFAVTRWVRTLSWRGLERPAELLLDEVQTGTVFEADGAPAVNVGVQPIWGSLLARDDCRESDVVVTTDRDGRFTYVGDRRICGLRIYRGTTMYEAPLDTRPSTTLPPAPPPPPPLPWPEAPAALLPPAGAVLAVTPIAINLGSRGQLIVRLRDPRRDRAAGFAAARARVQGKRGTWVHGRVVHAGAPVAGAGVAAVYPPADLERDWSFVTTRRDGSFDLFVRRYDDALAGLAVEDRLHRWRGRTALELGAAEPDVVIEIGAGAVTPDARFDAE